MNTGRHLYEILTDFLEVAEEWETYPEVTDDNYRTRQGADQHLYHKSQELGLELVSLLMQEPTAFTTMGAADFRQGVQVMVNALSNGKEIE